MALPLMEKSGAGKLEECKITPMKGYTTSNAVGSVGLYARNVFCCVGATFMVAQGFIPV